MILIMGPSGAGKSSQAKALAKRHQHLALIALGDLLRQSQDAGVVKALKQGDLVDDAIVTRLVLDAIRDLPKSKEPVLDGFPRRLSQLEDLEAVLPELSRQIRAVVVLNVSREVAEKRLLKRHRPDDVKKIIARKYQVFETETMPVINRFRQSGQVIAINGEGSVNAVTRRIERAIFDSD